MPCEEDLPTVTIPAGELTSGDTFPSHDGNQHHVEGVCTHAGTVQVNVYVSGEGRSYSVDFPDDYPVQVLA